MTTDTRPSTPVLAGDHWPILGHAWWLLRDPLGFLASLRNYGEVVVVRLGSRTVYAICAPEPLGELLVRKSSSSIVGGPLWDTLHPLLGQGLATINGPLHLRRRRMMQPWFQPDRVTGYAPIMAEEIRAMVGRWRVGETVDVAEEVSKLTVRLVSRCLLRSDSLAAKADEVSTLLHTVFAGMYRRLTLSAGPLRLLPTFTGRKVEQALARLRRHLDVALAERRANGVQQDDDLLAALLTAKDEETGRPLSDQEIRDHAASVLVAGTENVAYTLAWAFLLLTEHPHEEARLHEEVDAATGDHPIGPEEVRALSHTRNVLTESMRVRPALWLLTRHITEPVELGGHLIPADADVIYSPYALQRDARTFDQPLVFDPDRWSPERSGSIPRFAMMPFGTGNRKCAGEHFSLMTMMLTLVTVAARWRLTTAPGTDPATRIGITLQPRAPLLRVEAREHGD